MRFRQVHLDFHTSEYIPEVGQDFDAKEFAETLEKANVDSITCFARCHHGWLYYPSKKYPELIHPNLVNKNLLIEQIDACHEKDIKVPIYTTAQWDGRVMRQNPEWLAIDENGEYINTQGVEDPHFYHTICLNTGYREFFKDNLGDIIDSVGPERVDGIFTDILFQVDCNCDACKYKMEELNMDTSDKVERLRYSLIMLEEFKDEITEFIREKTPNASIFYNSSHVGPAFKDNFKAYSHLEIESLPSGGWGYDHYPATSRYARTLGKECIGMTGKFHTYWGDFHSLKNKAALEFECFNMLAMGAGCSIGDQLHPNCKLSDAAYDLIGHVYGSVKEKEPYCRNVKPNTEIAVITPEEFYPEEAKKSEISPSLIGTVRILQELSYQFDIVDSDANLSDYKLVILPDVIYYNDKVNKVIEDYIAQGGKVIGSYNSCIDKEADDSIYGVKYVDESQFYREFIMPNDKIGKELPKEEFVMYMRGYDVETTDSEVIMDKIEPYFDRAGDKYCSHQHAPSSGKVGYPAVTQKGNVIYFSHPIFHLYRKNAAIWCKLMVKDAIELLLDDKLVSHNGPSTVSTTFNHQEEENRDILHILHYITEKRSEDIYTIEDIIPLRDTEFKIYVGDKTPTKVSMVPEDKDIKWEKDGSYIKFTLDKIEGHNMVCIDY